MRADTVRAVRGIVRTIAVACVLAGLVVAPASANHHARVVRLQNALDHLVETKGGPPGAAVTLYRGGRERFLRAGVGNVRTGKPFTRQKHMRIASASTTRSRPGYRSCPRSGER